jgi:hypothetical protein
MTRPSLPSVGVVPDIRKRIRTMTREEIENYLDELVKKGHARVVGLTESGKKQYAMTEEGLFARKPNVEYALLVKVKERRVIMAVKHPTDTPTAGEDAGLNIFLCGSVADSKREDAVEIWGFVLPRRANACRAEYLSRPAWSRAPEAGRA